MIINNYRNNKKNSRNGRQVIDSTAPVIGFDVEGSQGDNNIGASVRGGVARVGPGDELFTVVGIVAGVY